MKSRLTIAVRRGLKDIANLAQADVDADRAESSPQFVGARGRDIDAALRWLGSIDVNTQRQPGVPPNRD